MAKFSKKLSVVLTCCLGLAVAALVSCRVLSARPDAPGAADPAATQAPSQPRAGGGAAARVDCYGDPLPEGALTRMGTVRQWYGRLDFTPKTVLAFLPDSKTLVSRGEDGYSYLWDVATGKFLRKVSDREISQLSGPMKKWEEACPGRAFSPDNKLLAVIGDRKEHTDGNKTIIRTIIHLRVVTTGKEICQLQLTGETVASFVNSVVFSPDSKTLASGGSGGETICVWEIASGKLIHRFKAGGRGSSCPLAYSPDGKTLLGGSKGHLWDVATGKEIRSFDWENAQVAVFSPNGKILAVGDEAGVIRLWEVATGKEILPHRGHQDCVNSIAYSPDGKTLASVSHDKTIRLWEVATGKEIRQLAKQGDWTRGSSSLAFSPDGKIFVFMDEVIHLWNMTTSTEIRQFQGPKRPESVTFSPDGKFLAATLGGQTVCRWQVATGELIYTLSTERLSAGESWSVVFSPDGRMLAVPGKDGTVDLWEMATGTRIGQLQRKLKQDNRRVLSLAFSPDGRILATSCDGNRAVDDKVHLLEVATGKEIGQLDGRKDKLTFSPDGRILATVERWGGDDKKIDLWEVATGKQIGQLSGHRGAVQCVVFSPDGKTLASSSDDRTCLVWDLTPFAGRLKPAPVPPLVPQTLAKERLEAAWTDLAKDSSQAYAAIWALQLAPAQAIPLLRERLRPVARVADPRQLQRWIADLDDNSFTVRRKAQQEIEKLGEAALPALRQVLKGQPALEVRRRLQDLLAELELKVVGGPPQRLRELRAVQVLESIGTVEAKQALQALAKGVSEASLTQEAQAALARLAKRSAAKP